MSLSKDNDAIQRGVLAEMICVGSCTWRCRALELKGVRFAPNLNWIDHWFEKKFHFVKNCQPFPSLVKASSHSSIFVTLQEKMMTWNKRWEFHNISEFCDSRSTMSKEMRNSEMLQRSKVQNWQLNLSRVLTLLQPSITSRCSFLVSIISASFIPVVV